MPLTNTESLQMIHEFFLKPRAVRGKCIFSGDWHVTPHISDDIQREFSKSIRTCTSDKSFRLDQKHAWMFQKDQTDMKPAVHYPGKQIKIQSPSCYPPCAFSKGLIYQKYKLLRSDWTNGWRTRAWFLSGQRFFSLLLCPDNHCGVQTAHMIQNKVYLSGLSGENEHLPPPGAKFKNTWRYNDTSPYTYMVWCFNKHWVSFTFTNEWVMQSMIMEWLWTVKWAHAHWGTNVKLCSQHSHDSTTLSIKAARIATVTPYCHQMVRQVPY